MQLSLAIVASFAALGGFLFGYDLGLIGGAILVIKEQFGTSNFDDACIVGAAKVGAAIGVFIGAGYMYKYGRRAAIFFDSIFFTVGPVMMASSVSVGTLILGRLMVGMGIGFSAVVVPAYLGEVAPANVRGSVVTLYELMLCVGMVLSSLADAALQGVQGDWRWMVGLPIVPGMALALAPLVLPESPRWLVMAGDLPSALTALHKIRCSQPQKDSSRSTADVENELLTLWNAVEQDHASWCMRNSSFPPQHDKSPRVAIQSQGYAAIHTVPELNGPMLREQLYLNLSESGIRPEGSFRGEEASVTVGNVLEQSPQMRRQQSTKCLSSEEHLNLMSEAGGACDPHSAQDAAELGVFRVACFPADNMHGVASPSYHACDRHGLEQNDREDTSGGAADTWISVAGTPQPPLMHAYGDTCQDHRRALNVSRTRNEPGFISWILSCCTAVQPPRHMHEAHAQVPDAEDVATHMQARYDMHTPMHLVLWHMIGDCYNLFVGAFACSAADRSAHMHDRGALYQSHSNDASQSQLEGEHTAEVGLQQSIMGSLAISPPQPPKENHAHVAQRRSVRIAVVLAFFNQISASTSIINYAPELLMHVGVATSEAAMELSAIVSCCKTVGIILGILLIDRLGRRVLLVSGSIGCAASMFALAGAVSYMSQVSTLASMCLYILLFSTCWAGAFWVVCSEIFSMSMKSPGMALATASLFLSGAVTDAVFPVMLEQMQGGAFVAFGVLAAFGGVYVALAVPETKGLSLLEVQAVLQGHNANVQRACTGSECSM